MNRRALLDALVASYLALLAAPLGQLGFVLSGRRAPGPVAVGGLVVGVFLVGYAGARSADDIVAATASPATLAALVPSLIYPVALAVGLFEGWPWVAWLLPGAVAPLVGLGALAVGRSAVDDEGAARDAPAANPPEG